MKTRLSLGFCLIAFVISVFAGAYMDYFHATANGDNVELTWKTEDESNLNKFVVQRKTPETSYVDIASMNAKGDNSVYSFIDKTAYKSNDLIFIYRLKLVDNDNSISYSDEASVAPNLSGVKRTWGSIKAMFR